jgi:hypothetical protein
MELCIHNDLTLSSAILSTIKIIVLRNLKEKSGGIKNQGKPYFLLTSMMLGHMLHKWIKVSYMEQ